MNIKLCKLLVSWFKLPFHPFNDTNQTYNEWLYEKATDTISYFLPFAGMDAIFTDKTVLDIGCGPAGKTLFYAKQGVKKIYGIEILEKYRTQADALAEKLNLNHLFEFVCANAKQLPFDDNSIDTVIMSEVFEHIQDPGVVLKEALRVLKPGGRVYLSFPPYHHPYGAHLKDAIGMPWVHLFFSDETLIKVYSDAVRHLPDGQERIDFRISKDENGKEYFSYINKMTMRQAKKIIRCHNPVYQRVIPLKPCLKILSKLPIIKEMFVKMVVYVFEK